MPIYAGRYNGSPILSVSTVDADLFSDPPTSNVIFRSDLPYLLTDEYNTGDYSDIAGSTGTIRQFNIPTEVQALANNLYVVLFYWQDASGTRVAVTPQYSYYGWVGGDAMSPYYNKKYHINAKMHVNNPSYCRGNTNYINYTNTTATSLTCTNPVLYMSGSSTIGFPVLSSYNFLPTTLVCLVINNLRYTDASGSNVYTVDNSIVGNGVKISRNEFIVGNFDFRNKNILAYSVNSPNVGGYTYINNNIPSVFPGIAKSWTIDNSSSITELTNGFMDSSRDYTTKFNIQMHSQLSNSRQSGTTIFSSDLYNIFRADRNVGFGNYTQPIFCTIKPTNSAGTVELNSTNSTISVNGSPLLYPGMAAIYNTRIGATYYSYGGSNSYVRVTPVSSESGYTSIDIANIPNVFSTSNGAGLLTVSTSYLMDTNTLAFDGTSWNTDTSGYYSFGANDYTSRHASLMALSDGQMFTLFTAGIGCDYYLTYGHYRAGFQYTCYLRRSGNNLIISIRHNVYLSPKWRTYHISNGYVDLWYQIPAFAFSFKEFNS